MSNNDKAKKVSSSIREALAQLVPAKVKDPRVAEVVLSISHVDVNRDGSVAYIYVAILGDEERKKQKAIEGLKSAAGFLRGPVARQCRLKRAPELRFVLDVGGEMRDRLREIVGHDDNVNPSKASDDPSPDEVDDARDSEH